MDDSPEQQHEQIDETAAGAAPVEDRLAAPVSHHDEGESQPADDPTGADAIHTQDTAIAMPITRARSRQTRRLGRQSPDAPGSRGRRLLFLIPLATVLIIVGVVLSGLGIQQIGLVGFAGAPLLGGTPTPATTPTRAPTATAPPTATSTPAPPINPNISRNDAMGCHNGAPPPSPIVMRGSALYDPAQPVPNEVALTFDDGPTPYTTPPILDYLEQSHTPATFFILGQYAHIWPYLVQREWRSGFAIGAHSWDHPPMTIVPDAAMPHQFGDTMAAIHAALGADACIWFWRPPYGSYDGRVVGIAQSYNLTTVMWNDDPADWSRPGVQTIASRVLEQARPGSIILMHDGPANREQTLAALPIIVEGLRERGLKPVTLPQLLFDSHYPTVDISGKPQRQKPDPTLAIALDAVSPETNLA